MHGCERAAAELGLNIIPRFDSLEGRNAEDGNRPSRTIRKISRRTSRRSIGERRQ